MTEVQSVAMTRVWISAQQQFLSPLVALSVLYWPPAMPSVRALRWLLTVSWANQICILVTRYTCSWCFPEHPCWQPGRAHGGCCCAPSQLPLSSMGLQLCQQLRACSSSNYGGHSCWAGIQVASLPPCTLLSLPGGRWEGHTMVIAGDEARSTRENQGGFWAFQLGSLSLNQHDHSL